MNTKKILFCTITAIAMLAPIGAVGLRYSNDIKTQLTKKEMIEQLEFKKIEKDVTIKLYPSRVKKEVDGSTKYFYTPESITYNDGTELKGATAITLPFDKKISDKQTRTTLFKGKAYLLKCRIPDALMDQKEKAAAYDVCNSSDAAGRTRTGTAVNRLILSQVRLPIPPQRHKNGSLKPTFIISYQRIKSKHFILGWKNRFPLVSE